jgi:hypothetical protein
MGKSQRSWSYMVRVCQKHPSRYEIACKRFSLIIMDNMKYIFKVLMCICLSGCIYNVDTSDYSLDCEVDADCIRVSGADICQGCANTVIARSELERFQEEYDAVNPICVVPPPDCALLPPPVCQEGQCFDPYQVVPQ